MGTPWVTCKKCRKKVAVESHLKMISTSLLVGQCPHCNSNVDVHVFQPKRNANASARPSMKLGKSIKDRVATNDVQEYWLIEYIKVHYKRLGIAAIRGHFTKGPDFQFLIKKRWRWAEVEVKCENYVQHKHHANAKWSECQILVVLSKEEPSEETRKLLPKTILHVDRGQFARFFRREVKKYSIERKANPQAIRNPGEGFPLIAMWGYDDGLPEDERIDPYELN